eukprot:6312440-Amphidinium_carterae.2
MAGTQADMKLTHTQSHHTIMTSSIKLLAIIMFARAPFKITCYMSHTITRTLPSHPEERKCNRIARQSDMLYCLLCIVGTSGYRVNR